MGRARRIPVHLLHLKHYPGGGKGYAISIDSFIPGMAAIAAPIRSANSGAIGSISVAGPSILLDAAQMEALAPALLDATREMAHAAGASVYFRRQLRG